MCSLRPTGSLSDKVVWVGGYPAHYVRAFHCEIERAFPGKIAFVYITNRRAESQRGYEQGNLPSDSVLIPSGSLVRIPKLMRSLNPRALIVAGHFPRAVMVAALWGFAKRRPVLYWSDTNLMDVKRRGALKAAARRVVLRPFLRRAYKLLYVGMANKEFYCWVLGHSLVRERLQFLPCPHNSAVFERGSRRTPGTDGICEFLYLGRLAREKCVTHLIEAFAKLSPEVRARARLTVAGDGTERTRLERLVQRRGLVECVRFIGPVASTQTPEVMNHADVFVLPSCYEPWGLVVNEALSAAIPVVAPSWVGAAADLIVTGHTGIKTKDNSPDALKEAMMQLINDPSLRRELGRNGRQLVKARGYDIQGAMQALTDILVDLYRT